MRWNDLFADLEAQLQFEQWHMVEQDAAELTRGMWSELTLMDRIRAAMGQDIRVMLHGGRSHVLTLYTAGPTWLGGADEGGALVIPLEAILAIDADLRRARVPIRPIHAGPTMAAIYRTLARRREALQIFSRDEAAIAEGTIDRVGKDHIDIVLHARDEFRRESSVQGKRIIPFGAIHLVRASPLSLHNVGD